MQRPAALCVSGAFRSIQNKALKAILSLPYPKQAGIEKSKIAAIRLSETHQWTPNNLTLQRITKQSPSCHQYRQLNFQERMKRRNPSPREYT